jgi:hypothetical protein
MGLSEARPDIPARRIQLKACAQVRSLALLLGTDVAKSEVEQAPKFFAHGDELPPEGVGCCFISLTVSVVSHGMDRQVARAHAA